MAEVALALEPTGPYGEALARWAKSEGWQVLGVLGAHTKRAKELWGNSPLKSDAKDARVICDLAVEGKWVTFSLREGAYAELKALAIYRQQLVRKQTALKHQTRALIYVLFPEFLGVVGRGLFKKSGLMLMERFPTPRSYATSDEDQLALLLRGFSGTRSVFCAQSGVPMTTLKVWMGHERIETTMIYATYSPDERSQRYLEAIESMGPDHGLRSTFQHLAQHPKRPTP